MVACALGLIVDPILEFPVTIPPPAVIPIVMVIAAMGAAAQKFRHQLCDNSQVLDTTIENRAPSAADARARWPFTASQSTRVNVMIPSTHRRRCPGSVPVFGSRLLARF